MFPAFANAALLVGLIGIAAPILIHLLLRRRSQRMRFSTVQFFVKTDEQSMRKRKLRNLFLLSLRVLVFTLLVLAFARPFLPNIPGAAAAGKRQQAIILLDGSASMLSVGTEGQQWKRAKDRAAQLLGTMQADDRAALVLCASHSTTVSGFVTPSVLAKKLEEVSPCYGTADLSEGFQQVLKLLPTANPAFETSLHVISDLHKPAVQNLASVALPKDLTVKIPEPGDRYIPNVAVTDLRLEREGDLLPHVVITSYSDESYAALPYALAIDGKETLAGAVSLRGGASTNLPLAIPALKSGWHAAEFTIRPKDGLPLDDVRYAAMRVPEAIRCVVVEPRRAERPYLEESFFVYTALNPSAAGEVSSSRFNYEKRSLEGLKLQPEAGKGNVALIVLPAVRQLSSATGNTLRSFVRQGGGLLLFLGETVSANSYNTELRDLLPAELGRIESAGDAPWHFAPVKSASPAFSLFRDERGGNLSLHEFTERFSLIPRTNAVVTAQFDDGAPLVLEQKYGEGRIILVNTSADTRWTDWQKHKSFVPWLHSTAFYLSSRHPTEQRETAPVFTSGGEVDFAVGIKQQAVKVQHVEVGETALMSDDEGVVRDVSLSRAGIYSLKDASGGELRRIAVNIPTSESDLSFEAAKDAEQLLTRQSEPEPTFAAGLFRESSRGKELWRLLLVGALLFLVVEPIVANRTAA